MHINATSKEEKGFLKNLANYADHLKCRSGIYDMNLGKRQNVADAPLVIPPDLWKGDTTRGHDVLQGLYSFSGQSFHSVDVLWEPEGHNIGWLTAMHGFDMLRDLKAAGGDRARQHSRYLIADWMENYSRWHPVSWQPHIISRRIVHWLSSYSVFFASADIEFSKTLLESLTCQAKYLSKHVKSDDLLYSTKALFYAGMALGQEIWCRQALVLLDQEIRQDILTDGGHISRSPENHLVFLQNLLDIRSALNLAGEPLPDILQYAVKKMVPVLRALRHNDGGLSLFHCGNASSACLCDMVLGQAGIGGRPVKTLGAMGYDRLVQGRSTVLVDTGHVAENQKYSGLLAFEFSAGKDRIVVNCGAWDGHKSWSDALSSTAAHATVTVENCNAFHDSNVVVQKTREEHKGNSLLDISHDGYLNRFGVMHRRSLSLKNKGNSFCGRDIISGMDGVNFAVRFHLHPLISASIIRDGKEILLKTPSGQGWIFSCESSSFGIEESVYVESKHSEAPRCSQQIVVYAKVESQETEVSWQFEKI